MPKDAASLKSFMVLLKGSILVKLLYPVLFQ
nr:MAG TPA: hypothetical protein [Caudoviricetes sp.]